MPIVLPKKIADMKESDSVFFVELYIMHAVTGDLYMAAFDVDIDWFIPNTTQKVTYVALPIQRGSIAKYDDDKIDNVDIQISDVTKEFSSALFNSFDLRGTMVDIIQIAYPDSLEDGSQYRSAFSGYIDSPSLDEASGVFKMSLMAIVPNVSNCRKLSLSCNAWFGDSEECGAVVSTHNGTVQMGSTQNVIYDSALQQAENYWKNGVITIGFESRKIKSSTAGNVVTEYPFFSIPPIGTSFSLQNGCDKSYADCNRHNNTRNFSGFPAIPFDIVVKS